jgi:hypothetical protein
MTMGSGVTRPDDLVGQEWNIAVEDYEADVVGWHLEVGRLLHCYASGFV